MPKSTLLNAGPVNTFRPVVPLHHHWVLLMITPLPGPQAAAGDRVAELGVQTDKLIGVKEAVSRARIICVHTAEVATEKYRSVR